MKVILSTHRLYLKQFEETMNDAVLIYHLNIQPAILRYLHELELENVEQALSVIQNFILSQYQNELGRWAVDLKR